MFKALSILVILAAFSGPKRASADLSCRGPVDLSNFKTVLSEIVGGIAARNQLSIVSSIYIPPTGQIVVADTSKSAASIVAKLNNGQEVKYTILIENHVCIGGFGVIE